MKQPIIIHNNNSFEYKMVTFIFFITDVMG